MAKHTVDMRTYKRNGLTRLRFYSLFPDQVEIIKTALVNIGNEFDGSDDCFALTYMAIAYLSQARGPVLTLTQEQHQKCDPKLDVRVKNETDLARMLFYDLSPSHVNLIIEALDGIRKEAGTEHDSVALTYMAMAFLNSSLAIDVTNV